MTDATAFDAAGDGKLVANITYFARTLRAAGLPVGTGKVIDAIRAVEIAGIASRDDLYWTLHAVFVNRRDQRELFDQTFHIFWRNHKMLEKMLAMMLPTVQAMHREEQDRQLSRRVIEALGGENRPGEEDTEAPPADEFEFDAVLTYSDRDVINQRDFDQMSAEEVARAKATIARLRLPIASVPTRRFVTDPRGGRVDMRATLRSAVRGGADIIPLRLRRHRMRRPPLVVLCDISGSMSRYSHLFLHFVHAITNDRDRVQTFLFGTRLTNVTRHLRHRDVDIALKMVSTAVDDWDGGTRIGHCLAAFNLHWSRRVLGQGAVVLLISDGLDRDAAAGLEHEIERLHKSCRRLIWLNPLLRYAGFEPKSSGIRAILPHVDDFRPVHNLASLDELAAALAQPGVRKEEGVGPWQMAS